MSRRHRRTQKPTATRASVPAGSVPRPIQTSTMPYATNVYGDNSSPVSAYNQGMNNGVPMFPPGDPIRPIPGIGDATGGPRQYGYPVGININNLPRQGEAVAFDQLRNLAAMTYGIQLCERVIFRVVQRLELVIKPRVEYVADGEQPTDPKWQEPARRMQEWFEEPDHRGTDLTAWTTAVTRDLLELDAVGIYHRQTKSGGLYGLEYVDGGTVACLIDSGGRVPVPPAPAYRQSVYGQPGPLFTSLELDYIKEINRTDSMYGLGPVESILLTVNQALRKQHYDLRRYTDGATPAGVLETQNQALFNLTADQVSTFELMFNAILAGNDAMRVRTKAVPPGWTFKSLQENAIATEFDRWLLNIAAAAFGITMDELGFTETSNRAVGDSQERVIYRNAVQPRARILANYFNRKVINRYDSTPIGGTSATISRAAAPTKPKNGFWDARFRAEWIGIEESDDFKSKVSNAAVLVNAGIMGRTEAKRWLKLPVQQDEEEVPAFLSVQGGMGSIVIVDDVLKNRDMMQQQRQIAVDSAEATKEITQKQVSLVDEQVKKGQEPQPEEQSGSTEEEASPQQNARMAMPHIHRFVEHRCMTCGCGEPENDHGMPYPVKLPTDTPHTGCMVALFLPGSLAQQLAVHHGESPQDLHITLAFLGDITKDAIDCDLLCQTVKDWAVSQHPITIDITSLERFEGNIEDGSPIVARSETPALHTLHDSLIEALQVANITPVENFPIYKPHVTLCYIPYGAPSPALPVPNLHHLLSQVWVAYGDRRFVFPLGIVPDNNLDDLRGMKADITRMMVLMERRR